MTNAPIPRRTARKATLWLGALLAALGAASCSVPTKRYPVTDFVQADNERVMWQALLTAIGNQKYPVTGVLADPVGRKITTGWKVDEVPFGRMRGSESFRIRALVDYRPYKPGAPLPEGVEPPDRLDPELEPFLVTLRIEKEHNESIRPGIARYAKWVGADDDKLAAERLLMQVKVQLGNTEFRLSDEKKDGPPHELDLD